MGNWAEFQAAYLMKGFHNKAKTSKFLRGSANNVQASVDNIRKQYTYRNQENDTVVVMTYTGETFCFRVSGRMLLCIL